MGDLRFVIEEEAGTGIRKYTLYDADAACFVSGNLARCCTKDQEPTVETTDAAGLHTYETYIDPEYKDITVFTGLVLEYPVYTEGRPEPVLVNKAVYDDAWTFRHHCFLPHGNQHIPLYLYLNMAPVYLPDGSVRAMVYRDGLFVPNPVSLVESRYILSIDEEDRPWLHPIFHAFVMGWFA